MPSSYDDVQGSRQDFDRTAVQKQNLAIHDYVRRAAEIEIDPVDCGSPGKRVLNMRTGEKTRKIPEQTEAADRRPTHIFDFPVGGISLGRHHHLAAGELAVGEREKKTRAPVPVVGARELMRERPMPESRERREYTPDITCGSPALEPPIGNLSGVGGKTEVQDVDEIDLAGCVAQSNHVAHAPAVVLQRLDRMFDAAGCKVAQERIARTERKQSQCRSAFGLGLRKKAVDDLKRSAIATHGEKIPVALRVGSSREARSLTRSARLCDFQFDTGLPNAAQRSRSELAAATASGRRIDDGKEARVHLLRTSLTTLRMDVKAARPPRGSAVVESVQPARPV